MDRSTLGWIVAALLLGLWWGAPSARAAGATRVECHSFYQDFPNGLVGSNRALVKAEELAGQVDPWLEQQFSAGATDVVMHSFIPFSAGGALLGGAEVLCVAYPAS